MEENKVNLLSSKDIYEILTSLKDIDPSGTKHSPEAKKKRKELAETYGVTDKDIARICKISKTFHKEKTLAVKSNTKHYSKLKETVRKYSEENYNINLGGFVFWENVEASLLFPNKNLVKYTKDMITEIFS